MSDMNQFLSNHFYSCGFLSCMYLFWSVIFGFVFFWIQLVLIICLVSNRVFSSWFPFRFLDPDKMVRPKNVFEKLLNIYI